MNKLYYSFTIKEFLKVNSAKTVQQKNVLYNNKRNAICIDKLNISSYHKLHPELYAILLLLRYRVFGCHLIIPKWHLNNRIQVKTTFTLLFQQRIAKSRFYSNILVFRFVSDHSLDRCIKIVLFTKHLCRFYFRLRFIAYK